MPSFEPDRRQFLQTAAAATAALAQPSLSLGAPNDELPYGIVDVIDADPQTGTSRAVVVGNVPLIHTNQFGKTDSRGRRSRPSSDMPPALDDVAQITTDLATVVKRLNESLRMAGCSLANVVKYNFYVSHPRGVAVVGQWLIKTYPGRYRPAASFVVNAPADRSLDYLVTVDCVAVSSRPAGDKPTYSVDAVILPPLHKLYVSGDAASDALPEVVAETLKSLEQTLQHCGLSWRHVVQLKVFLQPLTSTIKVYDAMSKYLKNEPFPTVSIVEWQSSEKVPLEIELIAAVPPELGNQVGNAVEYLTPPHKKPSPVFCRAVRVNSERTIYVSGLYGEPSDAAGQVRDILTTLQKTVEQAGGDLKHLVKATYYVSDDAASKALNEIRPEFYDPARPPAASKAMVVGTGRAENSITLDMIAVPKAKEAP